MSEHSRDTTCLPHEHDPQALSEAQLRHLYDEEEVERFLAFFSAYVTEVRLSPGVANTGSTEFYTMDNLDTTTGRPSIPHPTDRSLSEHIAYDYLLPHLPTAAGLTPTFTLGRLNLTIQRLCLALLPSYRSFLLNLAHLALWKDYQQSLRCCITFWFLWLHDLLLPALIFRIVYGLLRRRLWTYPTLKELQERRQDTAQALEFGEAVQQRLSVTTLGPMELWRLFKLYRSEGKGKAKPMLKDPVEADEEENFKRDMLRVLHELADLHERIKNIFTWCRPDVSRRYLLFLVVVGFGALILPAQYVAKLVYWFGGILFWHVTPVVAALPRGDRIRLLSLSLRDVPTDADYAMELIAKRVATGQDVNVASLQNRSRYIFNASASTDNLTLKLYGNSQEVQSSEDDGRHWKKWGERVARGKAFLEEGRQFLSTYTSRIPVSGETTTSCHPGTDDKHTFFAQYDSSLGLITLTGSTLFFTPLTGRHARLIVPRDRLRSVRRSGLMKGIFITWAPERLMNGEEREERFYCVGNRDELFARLVGSDVDGGRWMAA